LLRFFLCIPCKTKTFAEFIITNLGFSKFFFTSNFFRGKCLKVRSFINLPRGHVKSNNKCGANRFSFFDVYWIQTKQTDRQAKLLTQIRNIRKTILPTQLPSTIFKMCVYTRSISVMKHTHVTLAPFVPRLTLYTPQPSVRLGELGW